MKNPLIVLLLLLNFVLESQAQEFDSPAKTRLGVTAGYLNMNIKASFDGMNASTNGSGFYLGALADVPVGNLYLQPAVYYGNVEDSGMLYIPVMLKYYIGDSSFSLHAGPQASVILEELDGSFNAFGLDAAFGGAYDITDDFFLQLRYALELTDRIKSNMDGMPEGVKATINSFMAGVGYRF